jgi:hypothetical protein
MFIAVAIERHNLAEDKSCQLTSLSDVVRRNKLNLHQFRSDKNHIADRRTLLQLGQIELLKKI